MAGRWGWGSGVDSLLDGGCWFIKGMAWVNRGFVGIWLVVEGVGVNRGYIRWWGDGLMEDYGYLAGRSGGWCNRGLYAFG